MKKRVRTRRIAIVGEHGVGYSPEFVEGVFDFVEGARHWHLRGVHYDPFVRPHDVTRDRFDGLIVNIDSPEEYAFLRESGILAVNLSNFGESVPLPRVTHDDFMIGELAAEHLLGLGFVHFGFFGWPGALHAQQRLERFRTLIEKKAKLTCHVMDRPYRNADDRRTVLAGWIADCPKPIAIFGSGNYPAMVLAEQISAAGLSIPDDVALLGVGNERWAMPISPYRLSSVTTDGRRQGQVAARTLDRLLDGKPVPPVQTIPPTGVVARASTNITMSQDPLVRKAFAYIRDHASEGIAVEDVVDALDVSRSTLSNRMKQATGQTLHRVICKARIEHVKRLLMASDQTIEQIARTSGFTSQPRLNEVFQRLTGMTPSEYRHQRR